MNIMYKKIAVEDSNDDWNPFSDNEWTSVIECIQSIQGNKADNFSIEEDTSVSDSAHQYNDASDIINWQQKQLNKELQKRKGVNFDDFCDWFNQECLSKEITFEIIRDCIALFDIEKIDINIFRNYCFNSISKGDRRVSVSKEKEMIELIEKCKHLIKVLKKLALDKDYFSANNFKSIFSNCKSLNSVIQTFKKFLPSNYIDQLNKFKIKGFLYEQLNIYFKSFVNIEFNEIKSGDYQDIDQTPRSFFINKASDPFYETKLITRKGRVFIKQSIGKKVLAYPVLIPHDNWLYNIQCRVSNHDAHKYSKII